jgi:hypothetical protein
MPFSKRDEQPKETQHIRVRLLKTPIQPTGAVVLTVGIVITCLRPSQFVAREN